MQRHNLDRVLPHIESLPKRELVRHMVLLTQLDEDKGLAVLKVKSSWLKYFTTSLQSQLEEALGIVYGRKFRLLMYSDRKRSAFR